MSVLQKDNNGVITNYSGLGTTNEGLPLGLIFSSALPQSNQNYHLLNGDSLAITNYNDFYTLLTTLVSQSWSLTCTANEYAEDIAKTGNCGKFVINTNDSDITGTYDTTTITVTANSFKLPTIIRFIQGISSITDLGNSIEAGLPNITGSIACRSAWDTMNAFGVFTASGIYNSDSEDGSGSQRGFYNFDASRSSSIYSNSTTVQPASTQYPYYIVVKNNNSTGLISYLNNLAQAGVQSLGGAVGDITLENGLKMTNNVLGLDTLDLLWENPSPTSDFAAQTITLSENLSKYDYMVLVVYSSKDNSNGYTLSFLYKLSDIQGKCVSTYVVADNNTNNDNVSNNAYSLMCQTRFFTLSSNNITFEKNWYGRMNISYSSRQDLNIPYKVYGIKL